MARSSIAVICIALVLVCGIASSAVSAFAPRAQIRSGQSSCSSSRVDLPAAAAATLAKLDENEVAVEPTYSPIDFGGSVTKQHQRHQSTSSAILSSIGGAATGLLASASTAVADYYTDGVEDDLEIESLPPPWVPIIFAVVIIGGVGVLTSSLGDVMYDGELFWLVHLVMKYCNVAPLSYQYKLFHDDIPDPHPRISL